jgi:hypothetical protein
MNKLRVIVATVVALIASVLAVGPAYGQAYTTRFVTSITYQNVGTGPASLRLQFYNQNSGTAINVPLPNLPQNAGSSIFVGSITDPGFASGFRGAAVLSSDQPIVATMVQVPQGSTTVRNRPLANGFSADGGAANFLIATVLKNTFDQTTQFSVQNVDSSAADVTVRFINADSAAGAIGSQVAQVTRTNVPAGSVVYFDAGTLPEITAATFNGSAQISAVRTGSTTPGRIVATALELNIVGTGASSFEGVSGGSTTVYLPSAICNAFGGQSTAYAVQNTNAPGGQALTVEVTYRGRPENTTAALETFTTTASIAAGAKQSFNGCGATGGPTGMPAGYTGSATIRVTAGTGNIVAIAKVFGAGLSTAAPGVSVGASRLALPYVRYSVSQFDSGARQRTFIAIQNVGTATLAAGAVTVRYLDKNGTVVGTHTLGAIAASEKVNSNPLFANNATGTAGGPGDEFGYYADGTFGASAIIEGPAGSQLVAVARVQSIGVGEDYNGIPVAP